MTYRKKIDEAIATMREHGWEIEPGANFIVPLKRCCPMAALLLVPLLPRLGNGYQPYMKFEAMAKDAAKKLGVRPNVVEAFVCGFDGDPDTDLDFDYYEAWVEQKPMNKAQRAQARRFYAMGQQYRKVLIDGPLDPGF